MSKGQHTGHQNRAPQQSPHRTHSVPTSEPRRARSIIMSIAAAIVGFVLGVLTPYALQIVAARVPPTHVADALARNAPINVQVWSPNQPDQSVSSNYAYAGLEPAYSSTPIGGTFTLPNAPLVPVGRSGFTVLLRGILNQTVTILNIRPYILRKSAPLTGWLAYAFYGAGPESDTELDANLDDPQPVLRPGGPQAGPNPLPYFSGHSIKVANDETVPMIFGWSAAANSYYEWSLEIVLSVGATGPIQSLFVDRTGIVPRGNEQHPFTITGAVPAQKYGAIFALPSNGGPSLIRVTASDACDETIVQSPDPAVYPARVCG